MAQARDLRIDFFRGVALWIVLIDHIEGWAGRAIVESWTLISLGFSDAAEIFVFLSGYVFASAYGRTLEQRGPRVCLSKAVKRAFQIYVAYLLASCVIIAAGAYFHDMPRPYYNQQIAVGDLPWQSLLAALSLRFHPMGFDILAMYVLVVPGMALLLYVLRRAAVVAWGISLALYVVAQVQPDLNLPRFPDGWNWYFNPLAWQFLFFVGMALGHAATRGWSVPRSRVLLSVSLVFLVLACFLMKFSLMLIRHDPTYQSWFMPWYELYWAWGDKMTLQPLRLVHFFALAYVTSQLFPAESRFWSSRIARPIVVCGQHSLEVYAWGLVLAFAGALLILNGWSSVPAVLLLDAVGCALSVGFACLLERWKGRGVVRESSDGRGSLA